MQWRRVRALTPLSIEQSPRPSSATTPAARSLDRCGVPDSGTSKEKSAPQCARFGHTAGLLHARKALRNQSSFLLRFSRVKAEILETQNEYFYAKSLFEHGFTINSLSTPPQMPVGSCISRSDGDAAHYKIGHIAPRFCGSFAPRCTPCGIVSSCPPERKHRICSNCYSKKNQVILLAEDGKSILIWHDMKARDPAVFGRISLFL